MGGRPSRLISDGGVEFIVAAAWTRPEKLGLPFTHWSLRKLAGYLVLAQKLQGVVRIIPWSFVVCRMDAD